MLITYDAIQHFLHFWPCLKEFDLDAQVDLKDYSAKVTWRDQTLTLYPQFSSYINDQLMYTWYPNDGMRCFVGWRPYPPRIWPLSQSKLLFKDYVVANGFRTPAYSCEPIRSRPAPWPFGVRSRLRRGLRSTPATSPWHPCRSTRTQATCALDGSSKCCTRSHSRSASASTDSSKPSELRTKSSVTTE